MILMFLLIIYHLPFPNIEFWFYGKQLIYYAIKKFKKFLSSHYTNTFPSLQRLNEINVEQPDQNLLIGYGDSANVSILKYNVECDETLKLN